MATRGKVVVPWLLGALLSGCGSDTSEGTKVASGEPAGTGSTGANPNPGDSDPAGTATEADGGEPVVPEPDGDTARLCERVANPTLAATLQHLQAPQSAQLTFEGQLSGREGELVNMDGCPCNSNCLVADPWQLNLVVPDALLPRTLPVCGAVEVERSTAAGAAFETVSIWDTTVTPRRLVYLAGAAPVQDDQLPVTVELSSRASTACGGCELAESFDMEFRVGAESLLLAEGETGQLGPYELHNLQSFTLGQCGERPTADYVVERLDDAT